MELHTHSFLQGGKYRIEKVLGQGGFGITYLGTQVALNRKVAIKEFFMKEYCNRNEATSRVSVPSEGSKELVAKFKTKFIKEAQTIAEMDNQHIIRIHDVFEENGTAYYVMEYLQGGDLSHKIPSKGIPEVEALEYIRQVGEALSYIHAKNILHLDIKPTNILFRENGDVVLIDFGVSKHYDDTSGSQTSSTPVGISEGYAPTEQYDREAIASFAPSTDVYSLGATLYCLLCGTRPPKASVVLNEGLPALPTKVSDSTRKAVEKAMAPRRKDRPQSVKEFLTLLNDEGTYWDTRNDLRSTQNTTLFTKIKEKCDSILTMVIAQTSSNKYSKLKISSYTIKKTRLPILWILGIISQSYVIHDILSHTHYSSYTDNITFYSSYCIFFTLVSLCMIGLKIYRIVGVLITYVPIIIYYCFEC